VAREMIAKGEPVPITAKRENAHVIGRLAPRSVIYLQYVQGKRNASGVIASGVPDNPKAQYGDNSRLAIFNAPPGGKARLVALMPPNTKDEPFFHVVDHELENVVLRINDPDGDFLKNPDGGVIYRLYVQRP
jgi:hypothetical protein